MALVWFMLWLSLFLRADVDKIKRKNAIKGLVFSSITFIIVAWLMSSFIYKDPKHTKEVTKLLSDLPNYQWSTIRILLISTIDALFISCFIVWKVFKIINLKIGQEYNQLGQMRYKQDTVLGSIVLFANGEYLILFTVSQTLHILIIYLVWALRYLNGSVVFAFRSKSLALIFREIKWIHMKWPISQRNTYELFNGISSLDLFILAKIIKTNRKENQMIIDKLNR